MLGGGADLVFSPDAVPSKTQVSQAHLFPNYPQEEQICSMDWQKEEAILKKFELS